MTHSTISAFDRSFGFPLLPIKSFERLLFEAAAVTALSVSIFAVLSATMTDRASAQEINASSESIAVPIQSVEELFPNTDSAAALGKPVKIYFTSVLEFDCLVAAPPELRDRCANYGNSLYVLPEQPIIHIDFPEPQTVRPDRLWIQIEL